MSTNSYLICISRPDLGQVNRSIPWITKIECQGTIINSQTWVNLRPRNIWMKGQIPLRKRQSYSVKCILLIFFPSFPKGTYSYLPKWLCIGLSDIIRFGGLLDIDLEVTLIPAYPKHHCGPRVRLGAHGDRWNFSSGPFHSGSSRSSGSMAPFYSYVPSSRIHHWKRHLMTGRILILK